MEITITITVLTAAATTTAMPTTKTTKTVQTYHKIEQKPKVSPTHRLLIGIMLISNDFCLYFVLIFL